MSGIASPVTDERLGPRRDLQAPLTRLQPDEAERSWVLHLGTKLPQTLEIVVDHNPDELRKRN